LIKTVKMELSKTKITQTLFIKICVIGVILFNL
jgi:hypothetical protein